MAASDFFLYANAWEAILDGTIDLANDSFRLALVTSSYTPAQLTHAAWSAISGNEVANANGYTTHGKALTQSFTRSGLSIPFDVDDQVWTASGTLTAKYAVIVRDADDNGALAAGDVPVAYCDLNSGGGAVSATDDDFTITINASGVIDFTAAADS